MRSTQVIQNTVYTCTVEVIHYTSQVIQYTVYTCTVEVIHYTTQVIQYTVHMHSRGHVVNRSTSRTRS